MQSIQFTLNCFTHYDLNIFAFNQFETSNEIFNSIMESNEVIDRLEIPHLNDVATKGDQKKKRTKTKAEWETI